MRLYDDFAKFPKGTAGCKINFDKVYGLYGLPETHPSVTDFIQLVSDGWRCELPVLFTVAANFVFVLLSP